MKKKSLRVLSLIVAIVMVVAMHGGRDAAALGTG